MKRAAAMLGALIALSPAGAVGQEYGGRIALYSDQNFTCTEATDAATGVMRVYVVHENVPGAVASWFKLHGGGGYTGAWLSDEVQVANFFGNSQTGIHIVYLDCISLPAHILTVNYAVTGTSPSCSTIRAVPPTTIIQVQGCDAQGKVGDGGVITVNPDSSCLPLPAEPTTWGRIKSLFRQTN